MEEQINKIAKAMPHIKPSLEDYSHIDLTTAEYEEAILHAKINKHNKIEAVKQEEKRIADIKEMMRPKSTEELRLITFEVIKKLPFNFKMDQFNTEVFELLLLYFSNSPEFENKGLVIDGKEVTKYSLNKGILLFSAERGTGKTTLMEIFQRNSKNVYASISTKKITRLYEEHGSEVVDRFSKPLEIEKTPINLYQFRKGLCFEDLGDENIKNHYGNKANVMQQIILGIYDDGLKEDYKMFHATTNKTPEELEEIYGPRSRSRMREMFNMIILPGYDRRK